MPSVMSPLPADVCANAASTIAVTSYADGDLDAGIATALEVAVAQPTEARSRVPTVCPK